MGHKTQFLFIVFIFLDKWLIVSESQFYHLFKGDNNASLPGLLWLNVIKWENVGNERSIVMDTYLMFKYESYFFDIFLFGEHRYKHKICVVLLLAWVKMKAFI